MNASNLHAYQRAGEEYIVDKTHCGLFLEMGLGKTVTTLTAIDKLINEELAVDKVLVVAPKRVCESVWKQEAAKWDHLKHLRIVIVSGTEKQRKAALAEEADIYLIGRDNVDWLCGQYGGSMLPFDMLVIDESSSFKNHKAQRFKALRLVLGSFKRIVLLTGTPSPNSLMDLWPQLYILDRGQRLGKTITAYREAFFHPRSVGHIAVKYELNKGAEERIQDAIADVCMSMKAADYLELPERIENVIRIPMPEPLSKAYKAFEREKITELLESGATITAANAAVLVNKLLQFSSGALYDSEQVWHEVHKLKLEALAEIIEQAQGKPVLVAWTYRCNADRIEQYLKGVKVRRLKKDSDVQDWNAGKIDVMLMHPASGGHGLNLQAGGHIIVWFDQNWSLELEQQFNARLYRQGQRNSVIIHKLVIEGSADEEVLRTLNQKGERQNGLMEAVKYIISRHKKSGS